jgi:hypothetical protein
MRRITRKVPGIVLLLVSTMTPVYSQTPKSGPSNNPKRVDEVLRKQPANGGSLFEEFSFWIKDLKDDHQGELNNVNISVSFRYVANIANSEYPDFRLLAKGVEVFLKDYPNEQDYWEIVNKQLTSLLLKKYPMIKSITVELKVDPTRLDPYTRSSRVTRERPSNRKGN